MIKKNLFHKTKASGSDFRILADEELYIVNGGTGSLESEGTEATPEVQCDASNPGSDEDKLAELASQAVAAAEAPVESAPVDTTTVDSTPIETQTDSQVDNTVAETEGASLQGVNTVSSLGENVLAERASSQIKSLEQANYDARSGSYMVERGNDSSSSAEALIAAKVQARISANESTAAEQVKWEAPSPLQVDENGLYSIRDQSGDSTASIDMGTQVNQAVNVAMTDMRESALGLAESEPTTLDVTNQTSATAGLKVIDTAHQRPLNQQASIGAIKNRLDFTSNNLSTASENVASAEATYSDADMAKEMAQFTKNNILNQAATPMLAQANQMPQGILSLLQ